jgi:hypothetical protein
VDVPNDLESVFGVRQKSFIFSRNSGNSGFRNIEILFSENLELMFWVVSKVASRREKAPE